MELLQPLTSAQHIADVLLDNSPHLSMKHVLGSELHLSPVAWAPRFEATQRPDDCVLTPVLTSDNSAPIAKAGPEFFYLRRRSCRS